MGHRFINCEHRCTGKPIHLGSHAWQLYTAVKLFRFDLRITICYAQRSGHYLIMLILATTYWVSSVYINVKNQ